MKFNELYVGDTFNFTEAGFMLGTCMITSMSDINAGDIKLIYSSATNKCYPITSAEEFKVLDTEIELSMFTEVQLICRNLVEDVYNAISYLGNRIVYSSRKDEVFITKTDSRYSIYTTKHNKTRLIGKATSIEDAIEQTYVA